MAKAKTKKPATSKKSKVSFRSVTEVQRAGISAVIREAETRGFSMISQAGRPAAVVLPVSSEGLAQLSNELAFINDQIAGGTSDVILDREMIYLKYVLMTVCSGSPVDLEATKFLVRHAHKLKEEE